MKQKMTEVLSIFLCVMICVAYSTPALAGTEAASKDETQVTEQSAADPQATEQDGTAKNGGVAATNDFAKSDTDSSAATEETTDSDNDAEADSEESGSEEELPHGTDENISWAIDANGVMTISGTGEMKDYEGDDAPWKDHKAEITSVKFEEGITKIGYDTFNECTNLTEIDIPSSVTTISGYAFFNCTALKTVNLPASVTSLGYATFGAEDCSELKEVTFNNDDISIHAATFLNITGQLTFICNPDSKACEYAKEYDIKWHCIEHTSDNYTIDTKATCETAGSEHGICKECGIEFVKEIPATGHNYSESYTVDKKATPFEEGEESRHCENENCDSKKDVKTIPKTEKDGDTDENISWTIDANGAMTISGNGEMKDYESETAPWNKYKKYITSVKFEEGVTKIGKNTFNECSNLTDIDISSTVAEINDSAFYKCTALKIVNLPDNVASLGWKTFGDCTGLKEITINNDEISIDEDTFDNIERNILIRCNPKSAAWTFAKNEFITKECIGEHVWKSEYEVDEEATPFWEGKKSIHCEYCDAKKDTTAIPKTESDSSTSDNIKWTIDNTGLLTVEGEGKWYLTRPWMHRFYVNYVTKLIVGSGLTSVDPYFEDYPNLKEVELSDTVKTIEAGKVHEAFKNCPNLEKITIPNDNIEIGDNVFSECSKNLVIRCNPNSAAMKYAVAKGISWHCINHTYGDYEVDTEATCEKAGSKHRTCQNCKYEDVEKIPATGHNYSETYTTDKAATPFEEGEKSRHCENKNCDSRTDVTVIPKTKEDSGVDDNISWKIDGTGLLTISGEGAMKNYTALKTPWEKYKNNIKSVVVEDGITSIGRNAFYHFTKLESVTLADSVTSIGDSSFAGCDALKSIELPSGVTKVGSFAFKSCQSLEKVTIQSDTIDIEEDAFNDCGSISFICNPGSDAEAYAEGKDNISWQCINHTYGEYTTDAEPTCEKDGSQSIHCKVCDAIKDVQVIPATGHQWEDQPTVDVEATCEKDGSQSIHCKVCDATKDVQVILGGHKWTTYRKNAGYLKNGTSYSYCTVCKIKKDVKTLAGYSKNVVKKLKVKKGKKSFKVTWKKASKANRKVISGYQIRYSKKSSMASSKYVKAGKSSKGKKIKKLSKKTKYYVQVRNYTKKGGKTYYSKWSGKKTVRTK